MGLIKAGMSAIGGVVADQWKEFFICESIDNEVLVKKGQKKIGSGSSNTKGSDNIISNGSGIVVADGQCMIIVEQGKVVEVCAEPGEFVYDSSTEPSIFAGSLGKSIIDTFKTIGKRFTYGGDTGKDQRVYYFNTKEIVDNKFGTPNPVPFRVVDKNIGLDVDIAIRCNGVFSLKIVDPLLFYTNVTGNVESEYTIEEIMGQLKTEFIGVLQPALAKISAAGVRYSEVPAHAVELSDAMNELLSKKWSELRGIKIVSIGMNPMTISDEDADMIKELQRTAVMRNPGMAAATLTTAQADAMRTAAGNEAGAMMGFMGLNMAAQAGGLNAQGLFNMANEGQNGQNSAQATLNTWKCECGNVNDGKFCENCGKQKAQNWKCECGTENDGNFCTNCGKAKKETWKCECGTDNDGKFCTNCGKQK